LKYITLWAWTTRIGLKLDLNGLFPLTLKEQRKVQLSASWEIAAESRSFSFMFKAAESA
jgi:hypothetical protein